MSVARSSKVELTETLGIREHIYLGDFSPSDHERHHRAGLAGFAERDVPGRAVDKHELHSRRKSRPLDRPFSRGLSAANDARCRAEIASDHDVGVEQPEQCIEVTATGRSQERGDDFSLRADVCVGR